MEAQSKGQQTYKKENPRQINGIREIQARNEKSTQIQTIKRRRKTQGRCVTKGKIQ